MKLEPSLELFLKNQKLIYSLFWGYLLLVVIVGEVITSMHGLLVDNGQAVYGLETLTILITAGAIPLALKLFSKKTSSLKDSDSLSYRMQEYKKWAVIRLLILAFVFTLAIITYFMCMSSTGSLCAILIGFTAFFCIPSKTKILSFMSTEPQNDKEEGNE